MLLPHTRAKLKTSNRSLDTEPQAASMDRPFLKVRTKLLNIINYRESIVDDKLMILNFKKRNRSKKKEKTHLSDDKTIGSVRSGSCPLLLVYMRINPK